MKTTGRSSAWFWLLVLIFVFGLPALLDRGLVRDVPPPLGADDVHGRRVEWREMAGRPTLIYFWATWCPVCGAMQHSLQSVAEDHQLVSIALQSGTEDELRRYIQQHGLTLRVVADPAGSIAERYGLHGVPALFFVDRHGRIRFTATGYTTEIGIRIRLWLTAAIA